MRLPLFGLCLFLVYHSQHIQLLFIIAYKLNEVLQYDRHMRGNKESTAFDAKDAKEEERRTRQLGEQLEQLAYRAIGAAIEVHRLLGPGFLESVYQESLEVEFRMRGIACHPKKPVAITYKTYSVGEG